MKFELKKIDLFSAIKISFLINAILGLVVGLCLGIFMTLFYSVFSQLIPYDQIDYSAPAMPVIGVMSGFFFAVFYMALMAVINGIIITGLVVIMYNLIAGWLGGLKFELAERPETINSTTTLAS